MGAMTLRPAPVTRLGCPIAPISCGSRGTCGAPFPQTTACNSFSHYPLSLGNATLPFVIPSVAEGPAVRPSLKQLPAAQPLSAFLWKRHPPLCHPEQLTCLRQVEKEITPQTRHRFEARRACPELVEGAGRQTVNPARKGWGTIPKMTSAIGAALTDSIAPLSFKRKPRACPGEPWERSRTGICSPKDDPRLTHGLNPRTLHSRPREAVWLQTAGNFQR